ncbi:glutamyl-tRNA reductase [Roseimicrobium gellanilyticum]|uniref:Glutamyl-tRNA reductase n=1 Tax=Roseimicrobium gellanilyticum TaxID=748857 RepID=A0A366HRT5_9BACT|nr:glutamyl-tRNA reductase [Roseimicrobium gellanilyticum]RBP45458.1 glutamyl-tRNA reductase [Roseimicrobium gellanilyticum]
MLLCLGLNHRTTPIELRERLAFAESKQPEAALQIQGLKGFEESVVLSTCNRVELFASCDDAYGDGALDVLFGYLVDHFQLTHAQRDALSCYRLAQADAARHLFRVVSGLDSMVLGETEIFGQVKSAYDTALKTGTTGRMLNKLFQRAFSVGKQVRNETNIQRGSTSVGSVAVDVAAKIFGSLKDCRVLLIGAGEMSRTCAQSLLSRGAKSIIISNRSHDRAVELAKEMGGEALRFESWERAVHEVDIIISSTSAPHFVVTPELVGPTMRRRHGRPLFIIDIAVPRDVDPRVNDIEDVYLYDMDALKLIADEGRRDRERALAQCEEIIEEQLRKFGYHEDSPPLPVTVTRLPDPPLNLETPHLEP